MHRLGRANISHGADASPKGLAVSLPLRQAIWRLQATEQQGGDPAARISALEKIQQDLLQTTGALPPPARAQTGWQHLQNLLHHSQPVVQFVAKAGVVAMGITAAVAFAQLAGAPTIVGGAIEYLAEAVFTTGVTTLTAAHFMSRSHTQQVAQSRPYDPAADLVVRRVAHQLDQLRHVPEPEDKRLEGLRLEADYRNLAHRVTHHRLTAAYGVNL